jgi:phage terminase large subunit-like protein
MLLRGPTAPNKSRDVKDWIRTRSDEVALEQGCYFDYDAALRVRAFFSRFLRHSTGVFAGKPFDLLPWQWDQLIAPAFGWKMPDGSRRFKEVELWIPKKNGKSTLMAAVAVYLLTSDGEDAAQVYSAASDRNQASLIFNEATSMVKKSPALQKAIKIRKAVKEMHYDANDSVYKVISATGFRNEGFNIHGLLFDELHTQQNRKLWAALRYGTAARRQGIKFITSTAGEDDPTLLWYERFSLAKQIQASKVVDIHLLPCVYALEDDEDVSMEDTWMRCNPSYGVIVNSVEFKRDYENSLKSSANEMEFLRYRLNKATKLESTWIRKQYWQLGRCDYGVADPIDDFTYIGVDLADTVDLNAEVKGRQVIHPEKGACIEIKCRFWTASESVHRLNGVNKDRYEQWAKSGDLIMIQGPIADQEIIEDAIILGSMHENVKCIGIDRFNAARFANDMAKKYAALDKEMDIRLCSYNAATMNDAVRWMEELIYMGRILHDGSPIMEWMFSNIKCVQDSSGNRKLDKSGSQGKKIDGFSALCIMMYCLINTETEFESRYNTPGEKPYSTAFTGSLR